MFQFEEDGNFFGEDPFELYARENNSEAIRALLNDQFPSFEDIVTRLYPKTLVALAPSKIHNTIEPPETIRGDFQALLGEKIAKMVVSQSGQTRCLQSPFQIALHYFIKNVYSDGKTKLKMPDIVIRSYGILAANIVELQDFTRFLKLVRVLNLPRVFEEVEPQLLKLVSEEQAELVDWKFFKSYANFDEEKRLITRLHIAILSERVSKQKANRNQHTYQLFVGKLRDHPYQRLLQEMLESHVGIFNAEFNEVILKSHLDCDYKADTYHLTVDSLHPSLREWPTVFSVFKHLSFKEGFRCVINAPVVVENNHVLLRYNYQMLAHLVGEGSSIYLRSLDSELITKYLSFFKLLLQHSDLPFVTIGDSNHDDAFNIRYTCKAFELLQKAMDNGNKFRPTRSPVHLTETFMIGWIRVLNKWLANKKVGKQKFIVSAVESVFAIFECTDNEQNPEFPGLFNAESEISKCLCEMMLELEDFRFSSAGWKGVSLVLLKWGQSVIAQNDSYKQLIRKLLVALFDPDFSILVHRGEDLFDTPAISKVFKKMLSQQLFAIIEVNVGEIQKEQINGGQHPAIKRYNHFVLKIAMILSSKIPFDLIDGIAKLLYKLYRDYAHLWPLLYSFRLWILQMGHEPVQAHIQDSIDGLAKLTNEFSIELEQEKMEHEVHEFKQSTIHKFSQFENCSNRLINLMQLKKHKDVYSAAIYSKYCALILLLEARYVAYAPLLNNEASDMKQWIRYGVNIGRSLLKIKEDLKINIRYYLCNSSKLLHVKEEEHIMLNIASLLNSSLKGEEGLNTWKFINELTGFTQKQPVKSNLLNRQILGPLSRYTSKHSPLFKMEEFLPFNLLSTLYSAIRPRYADILRAAFRGLEQGNNDEQIWQTVQKILLPSVNTSGPCLFNGQNHEKSKEEMVLGIYFQQFEKLTEVLIEGKQLAKADIGTVVKLQKRKLISKFLQILKLKTCKIVEKVRGNPPPQTRYRSRPSTVQDVIAGLFQMGIPRDQAQIALENIEYPDQNLAVEWIDGNQDRLEQLVMQRAIDRSRNEGMHKVPSVRENEKSTELVIGVLPYQKFCEKEKILKCIRTWIKGIYKELFQTEQLQRAEEIKQLLFLFMEYLKPETIRIKQYDNLNEKVYKDLDQLNREENISGRIKILMSILEGSFDKVPKAKTEFYSKAINLKILSFLPRIHQPQNQIKLFGLINATLPVFSPSDILSAETKNYLNYLLDLTFRYRHPQKYLSDILFKIGKSRNQAFMQRITRNFTLFLEENLIQDNIMPLITLIFQCDPQLSQVNAELDLKTYLFERYKGKLATFLPQKEHVLEIDIKEFASNFSKYDKGSAIYEVSKRLLTKKKNKNRYFYYDCRREDCAFDFSSFGNCFFVNHGLKDNQRRIIKSLLSILFRSRAEQQEQLIQQIHKILLNYRILLPYTISETVEGQNLIDWLLASGNHSKSKHKLLVFLTLNANLFIRTTETAPYSFYSIGDYVCARVVKHLFKSDTSSSNENAWKFFSSLYLLQVKKFSQYASTLVSEDNRVTLEDFYESLLPKASQKQFLVLSEFLYVQYKKRLLDNLRRKYKFVRSQEEDSFDRQFLNLSPFFNSLPLRQTEERQKGRVDRLVVAESERENEGQLQEEEYLNEQQMLMGENVRMRFVNRNAGQLRVGGQVEQLIVPIQQKQSKESKEGKQNNEQEQQIQPIVIRNQFYIEDVLRIFEQYLSFQEEIQPSTQIQDTEIPNGPVQLPNQNASFKVAIEELPLDIEMRVAKLSGFQKRMTEVIMVLDFSIVWQKKKEIEERGRGRLPQELSRRLLNLNHLTSQNREEMIAHLERMASRLNRDEQPEAQPNVRVLNTTDIFQNVQEFVQPVLPVVEKQAEQPMVIELQPPKEEQQSEPPKQEQPIALGSVEVPPPVSAQIVVEDSSMPALLSNIAQLNVQENLPFQQQMQIEQNNPIEQEIVEDILPVVNELPIPVALIQQVIGQPQVPPVPQRDRQILRVYGLPQSYLQDVGLDEQLFDQLPEDLQQEQLMQYIAQHGNNANRNQPNNPRGNEPVVVDQQSQNLAFIASLDHLTRTQVLLEATPEFLNTLPAAIREEAERYRHQQISSLIEQEDIEQERTFNNQKAKHPVVYPKVRRQQFSKISDETARVLFEGVFMVQATFKLSVIKLLIENKQTQEKTVASIITLLKYFELKQQEICGRSQEVRMSDVGTERREINGENINYVRKYLLHIIYEHLKSPLYADEEFIANQLEPDCYCQDILQEVNSTQRYEPQTELLYFALGYYPDLATELVKKAKDLPDELLTKIVQLIRKDSLPKQFYGNLQNFSNNQRLKEIFSAQFEDRPPETQVLGLLLKYKFSHLLCLRRIHAQSLEYFSPKHREFLNQIFSIYTLENISEIEPLLLKHKQTHFEVIKYLYQTGRELQKEPIGLILKKPHLLDFQTKKFIFRNHPRIRKQARHRVQIEVDRNHLFQGSYNQLMSRTVRELQGRIQVAFINEPGYDAGGLKREWFLVVSREIFNQNYCLFEKSSSGSTYQPNPKSYVNPDHLNYFKFIGRFIGKALVERELIDAFFTRAFYKMILGQQLQFKDLEQQDYEFYKSMLWLKENTIDENMFTFSYIYDNFGNRVEKELVAGGKGIIVDEANKKEYIEKYCLAKMRDDFSSQINKFLEGFHEIVPQECISYFEAKELELLISGVPEVDLEDLKGNTDYSGYNPTDQIIVWFWEVVSDYSQEDLAKLVQFITGTSKIPVEGFSQIVGMNGIQRISIHRDPCEHQLPKSHTCFNQLDLPNYASKEILKTKLGICLAWGSEGFGFM